MSNPSTSRRAELERQRQAQAKKSQVNRAIGIGAAILALVLGGILVAVLLQSRPGVPLGPTVAAVKPPNGTAKADGIVLNPGKAKPGAPVVSVYVDYQCPVCKQFEESFGPTLAAMGEAGEIELVNRTMVFMDKNLKNTASTRSAIGAACADAAGVYPAYNEAVFAAQPATETIGAPGYSDALLRDEIPAKLGLTGEKLTTFQQCYDGRATADFVTSVDKAAYAAGVTGTPTLMVNGKTIPNNSLTSIEALKAAIAQS